MRLRAGRGGARRGGRRRARPRVLGQVGQVVARGRQAGGLVLHQKVAAARDLAVHARAAHLLERHLLADHHLGHARRAQVHRGVALDHEHDVAERRDVGAARRRRPEQQADLRDRARQPHLVAEDAPGVAAAREHVDLIGDARAGRVDQIEQRDPQPAGGLLDADDLLDRARAPRAGLHRRVVGHDGHRPPVHPADAGDHAVGGQIAGRSRWRSRPSSTKSLPPSSHSRAMRSRQNSLPGGGVALVVLGRPALADRSARRADARRTLLIARDMYLP